LLYIPNLPAFPRSSNPSSKLPRLPTFRAHLAKTRILDRLEAQDLTPQENESIMPFARHEELPQPDPTPIALIEDGESEEGRKITDTPGRSRGLEAWTRRPPALQRFRVWQPDNTRYWSGDGDNIKYEPLSASTPYRTELVISGGTKALAGLVPSSPTSHDWEIPNVPISPARTLPTLYNVNATSLSLGSFTSRSIDSPIIDESMLMDASDALPGFTPTRAAHSTHAASASPRPLPIVPGNRSADAPTAPTPAMAIQQVYWATQEEEHSPIIPVRPLPPRPLPMPPSSPKVTVDELESIDGPVIVTTTVLTPKTCKYFPAGLTSVLRNFQSTATIRAHVPGRINKWPGGSLTQWDTLIIDNYVCASYTNGSPRNCEPPSNVNGIHECRVVWGNWILIRGNGRPGGDYTA
jgi:hypothetical protein